LRDLDLGSRKGIAGRVGVCGDKSFDGWRRMDVGLESRAGTEERFDMIGGFESILLETERMLVDRRRGCDSSGFAYFGGANLSRRV
jgi:hypothetical protein